jgi:hypothetical protein
VQSPVEEIIPPAIACLCSLTLCEWHLGEIASSRAAIAEAISLAKELNNMHAVVVERSEERCWWAELHRLRGVFLAATGADESQIEASFQAAIRIAKEQKSVSLEKRAEGTYAEYRRQKASGSGGRGLRLPL